MSSTGSYTSLKEIVGRVVRNVGRKLPGYYADDMIEWISEGIRQLETVYQLETVSTPNFCDPDSETGDPEPGAIFTKNHVAPLPLDLIELVAVEDEYGRRVKYAGDQGDFTNPTHRFSINSKNSSFDGARSTNFQIDVFQHQGDDPAEGVPGEAVPYDGSDIVQLKNGQRNWSYKIQGNMIQTSEESMFIKLHYLKLLTDEEGYLLIPNEENYKQALYWYVLAQLIGAGYKHDIFVGPQGFNLCMQNFEKYAGRALGIQKMPSVDKMERLRTSFAERLVPPRHFYEDFFSGSEQTQFIDLI